MNSTETKLREVIYGSDFTWFWLLVTVPNDLLRLDWRLASTGAEGTNSGARMQKEEAGWVGAIDANGMADTGALRYGSTIPRRPKNSDGRSSPSLQATVATTLPLLKKRTTFEPVSTDVGS